MSIRSFSGDVWHRQATRARVISTILKNTPEAAKTKNGYGSMPLHVISQRGMNWTTETKERLVNELIDAFPDALTEAGGTEGLTPLHIIFTALAPSSIIRAMIPADTFSAKLRLSRDTTDADLDKLTERMLHELGLVSCADTFVGGPVKYYECECLLVATGRVANVENLGLEHAGIEYKPGQGIVINDLARSVGNPNVYSVGDCTAGVPRLTHGSGEMAKLVVQNSQRLVS